ncbi:MFS transporter [Paenibacillus polysaccharolyticus]|uniref:MFS transporter n=1 Tax=Paenibacillus polysaccharolyticus TaxID=582692 RepID=UPI00164A0397|nr:MULTISPECIES: MFS transporter [Paenibacillus]
MRRTLLVYLVSLAAFFGPFTQTLYSPLLPELANKLQTSQDAVNLSIAIYPIFFACMQLVYGPLLDRYGRRKMLLIGFMFYVCATIGVALSDTVTQLIIFRALQAIGVAVGSVAAITIIGDLFEGKKRGRSMGIYQMLVALGPGLGPVVGGIVGQHYGVDHLFWLLFAVSLSFWLILFLGLPETWTPRVNGGQFRLRQMTAVLNHRIGLAIVVLGSVQYAVFYTLLVLLPNILIEGYDLTPSGMGWLFMPISVCIVIGSMIGGRLQEYVEAKKSLLLLAVFNMMSILLFVVTASLSISILAISLAIFGLTLGLSLPVQITILADEMPNHRASATGVYNFFRYVWMTIGPIAGTSFYRFGYKIEFLVFVLIFVVVLFFMYSRFFGRTKESRSMEA